MFAEDMFGDDDDDDGKKEETAAKKAKPSPAVADAAAPATETTTTTSPDFTSMGIKDLKQYITSRGGDPIGAVEKADLVARAKALKTSAASTSASASASNIPEGYVLDASSGMYYSAASGMWQVPSIHTRHVFAAQLKA